MGKHTPGPWHVNDGKGCRWIETSKDDVIARIYKDACSRETFDANASLIAAAPDLLDALERVVHAWTSQFEMNGHIAPDWCKTARAAIAKATGVEQ